MKYVNSSKIVSRNFNVLAEGIVCCVYMQLVVLIVA